MHLFKAQLTCVEISKCEGENKEGSTRDKKIIHFQNFLLTSVATRSSVFAHKEADQIASTPFRQYQLAFL